MREPLPVLSNSWVESEIHQNKGDRIGAAVPNDRQPQISPPNQVQNRPKTSLKESLNGTRNAKAQTFYMAQEVRSENWRDRQDKPKMERTISIFRALIASDTEDIYHMNHGQLGFALKDQRTPDYIEAEAELTKAMELRGPWIDQGWLLYEFVRAYCRIKLDEAFEQEKAADEDTKQGILDDLKAAANARGLVKLIKGDPEISKWMEINGISMAEITP